MIKLIIYFWCWRNMEFWAMISRYLINSTSRNSVPRKSTPRNYNATRRHAINMTKNMHWCGTEFCDEVVGFRHPTFARLPTQKLRTYIYYNSETKEKKNSKNDVFRCLFFPGHEKIVLIDVVKPKNKLLKINYGVALPIDQEHLRTRHFQFWIL